MKHYFVIWNNEVSVNQNLKPSNFIQTVEGASSNLDILGQSSQRISIRELSNKIRLTKGTTHRLLSSLSYFGYVRQDPKTRDYFLGFKLGNSMYRRSRLQ